MSTDADAALLREIAEHRFAREEADSSLRAAVRKALRHGWSVRRAADASGLHRQTVARILTDLPAE